MSKKKVTTDVFSYDGSIKRALVVVAHPDDIDFGSAGTIAILTSHGVDVAYCLVTSGDAGGDDSTHTKEERAALREAEDAQLEGRATTKDEALRIALGKLTPPL